MTAARTYGPAHSVDTTPTVSHVVLNGRRLVRLCEGRYYVADYATCDELVADAARRGIDITQLRVR